MVYLILCFVIALIYFKNQTVKDVFGLSQFYVIQAVVHAIQAIWWRITGVRELLSKTDDDGACVHVQHIIHRGVLSAFNHPRPWDFIALHKGFTSVDVLHQPTVTIYCVTETHAWFVETLPHIQLHHSSTSPFFYMAQFKHAHTLLSVPLERFHMVAEDIGDPRVPVTWISNTGRCGSTLLLQMLEQVPGVRCFSEPDCLTNLNLMAKAKQLPPAEIRRALRSSVRFICRPAPGVDRVAVKTRFNCVTELEEVMDMFPTFTHVYMYRHTGETMKSYHKLIQRDLACRVLQALVNSPWVTRYVPAVRRYLVHFISAEDLLAQAACAVDVAAMGFMGWSCLILLSPVAEFVKIQERHPSLLPTLHYNRLMARPAAVTQALFVWLGLEPSLVPQALEAMSTDTQAGTMLSNAGQQHITMSDTDCEHVNLMLRTMDLATMDEMISLPVDIEDLVAEQLKIDEGARTIKCPAVKSELSDYTTTKPDDNPEPRLSASPSRNSDISENGTSDEIESEVAKSVSSASQSTEFELPACPDLKHGLSDCPGEPDLPKSVPEHPKLPNGISIEPADGPPAKCDLSGGAPEIEHLSELSA